VTLGQGFPGVLQFPLSVSLHRVTILLRHLTDEQEGPLVAAVQRHILIHRHEQRTEQGRYSVSESALYVPSTQHLLGPQITVQGNNQMAENAQKSIIFSRKT
jgi:hypothetical protein